VIVAIVSQVRIGLSPEPAAGKPHRCARWSGGPAPGDSQSSA